MTTILLVDDSSSVRQQLRFILQNAGYPILEAYDGAHALQVVDQCKVALIISDLNMPHINGLELLQRLKPRERAIPFLMLTVERNAELVDRARRAGAAGWIIKPFKADRLLDAVRKLLTR
jgi:two-component system chemotaxis response regulator CheY